MPWTAGTNEQRRRHEQRFCPSATRIIISQEQDIGLVATHGVNSRVHFVPHPHRFTLRQSLTMLHYLVARVIFL